MEDRIRKMTSEMRKTDGATRDSLRDLSSHFGVELPPEYIEFMTYTNGAAGPIGENGFLQVWAVDEVSKSNSELDYITADHAEWLFFGSNGGGTSYAFDTSSQPQAVIEVDLIDPDNNEVRGRSFGEFLENLYTEAESSSNTDQEII